MAGSPADMSAGSSAGARMPWSWASSGLARRSVAGAARSPGRASRTNARAVGNSPFSATNAGPASRIVPASSGSDASSCVRRDASASTVRSRPVTRSASCERRVDTARVVRSASAMKRERSCRSRPRSACAAMAPWVNAGAQCLIDRLNVWAPPLLRAVASSCTTPVRSSRELRWSDDRIWSSWTGVAVCAMGIV